jgi:hypothetical protein
MMMRELEDHRREIRKEAMRTEQCREENLKSAQLNDQVDKENIKLHRDVSYRHNFSVDKIQKSSWKTP